MSSLREVSTLWTCDACGATTRAKGLDVSYPPGKDGWREIVLTPLSASTKLGNVPSKHLCGACGVNVELILNGGDRDE